MTKIAWTGQTWNPIAGCSVTSPGCTNCYAMRMAARLEAMGTPLYQGLTQKTKAGAVWTGRTAFSEKALIKPLRWKKPRRIFVDSMSDLFHESVPDDWIDRVFAVMALCPQHTFQVLTKRADRMREYMTRLWYDDNTQSERITAAVNDVFRLAGYRGTWGKCGSTNTSITPVIGGTGARESYMLRRCPDGGVERFFWGDGKEIWRRCSDAYAARVPAGGAHTSEFGWGLKEWPLPNVHLGVTAEDQARADERIPHLLATLAAVRFVSVEPMLGPVNLQQFKADWAVHGDPVYHDALSGHFWAAKNLISRKLITASIDWVICGAESGPGARPMQLEWARDLLRQCRAAGVPFFMKQITGPGGKAIKDMAQFPDDLQVQEWPQ